MLLEADIADWKALESALPAGVLATLYARSWLSPRALKRGLMPRLSELTSPAHATESSHMAWMSAPKGELAALVAPKGKGSPPLGSAKVCTLKLGEYSLVPMGPRSQREDATERALLRPPMWSTSPTFSACLPVHTRPCATYIPFQL